MNTNFFKSALRANLGRTIAQRGHLLGRLLHLLVADSGEAELASTVILSDGGTPGKTSLRRELHNHNLSCTEEPGQVVTGAPRIQEQCETLHYP